MLSDKLRRLIGYIPFVSNYVFMDADAIFDHLRGEGAVKYIQNLRPAERRLLHFSLGTDIRNAYLLWHPKNPYTMLRLAGLSDEQQANSPAHPDNYSWSIIRRMIVAAGITDSQTSADFDASESLVYSLMARSDDSEETLDGIRSAVAELIKHQRWDLLDDVYEETILFGPSPAKLGALLNATVGYGTKITPINYLRVAQRAISYGVSVPKDDGV